MRGPIPLRGEGARTGFAMQAHFRNEGLEWAFKFGSKLGYEAVEITAHPRAVPDFDPDEILKGKASEIINLAKKYGLIISALTYHANMLNPDLKLRKDMSDYYKKIIQCAAQMDVPVTTIASGAVIPGKNIDECWNEFGTVIGELAEYAEEHGVKIAIEGFWDPRNQNIVYSPESFEKAFQVVPSKSLGWNYDPSHLIWQRADYIAMLLNFKDRIFHVHGKDTEILTARLAQVGIMGSSWWRFRIPGWGEVDWKRVTTVLREIGYEYVLSVENEDRTISREEAFEKAIQFLKPLWSTTFHRNTTQ